jgi:hypothetical protein
MAALPPHHATTHLCLPLPLLRLVCACRLRQRPQLRLHLSQRGVGGLAVGDARRTLRIGGRACVGGVGGRALTCLMQVPPRGTQPLDVRHQRLHFGLGVGSLAKLNLVCQAVGRRPPHLRCYCLPGRAISRRPSGGGC